MRSQEGIVDNVDIIFDKKGNYTLYILSKNREIQYFVLIDEDRLFCYKQCYPQYKETQGFP